MRPRPEIHQASHDADGSEALVGRLRAGDEHTFRNLLRRHHSRMVSVAMAFVANRATAEEVVQETWLAVIEGLPALEEPRALRSWIYSILLNKARRRGARESRIRLFSDFAEADDAEPATDPDLFTGRGGWAAPVAAWNELDPERVVSGRQLWKHVQAVIDGLPGRQRAVLLLCDMEQSSGSEAARLLGVSEANQRVLLHRARLAVRQAIDRLLHGDGDPRCDPARAEKIFSQPVTIDTDE